MERYQQLSPVGVGGGNGLQPSCYFSLNLVYENISLQYVGIWRGLPLADPLLSLSCQPSYFSPNSLQVSPCGPRSERGDSAAGRGEWAGQSEPSRPSLSLFLVLIFCNQTINWHTTLALLDHRLLTWKFCSELSVDWHGRLTTTKTCLAAPSRQQRLKSDHSLRDVF